MGTLFRSGCVALVLVACGGIVGAGQGERCPASDPSKSPGTVTCATEGLMCTYGDEPTTCGRTVATCTGGRFEFAESYCPATPHCPTQPPVYGSSCIVDCGGPECTSGSCTYPRGVFCNCWMRAAPFTAQWSCTHPLADTRCPDTMPNLGASCSVEGASCDYNHCQDGWATLCKGGVWKPESFPCAL
jgi:hypothetical protein